MPRRTGPYSEMRERHRQELRDLCLTAITEAGSVKGAAERLGCHRSRINQILKQAGLTGSDVLASEQDHDAFNQAVP